MDQKEIMNPWIERLSRKPTAEESAAITEQRALLDGLRQKTETLSSQQWEEGLFRLAPYRLKSSSTLKRGDVESWQQANSYVAQKIQCDEHPTWHDVLHINALLLGNDQGAIRTEPIYLGPIEACPLDHLSESLEYFSNSILNLKNHPDALTAAALCQYWLVSLHSFNDANGRTAILLADWILGSTGYLPLSFETKLDAIVATLANDRPSATAGNAVLKLISNVQRSYRLILSE